MPGMYMGIHIPGKYSAAPDKTGGSSSNINNRHPWFGMITGSSRGLRSRHHGSRPGRRDTQVVATARNTDSLKDLKKTYGDQVATIELDVTSETGAAKAVQSAIDQFGRLDILVNNAWLRKISIR